MKRLFLITTCLIVAAVVNAQSLEDIIKNYSIANKLDKLASVSTIKLNAKMSMMGMEIPMELLMKNPDKVKAITKIAGQEMIQVFDGTKGYMINPMTGSSAPVEMTGETLNQFRYNNMFRNTLTQYMKEGKLTLDGEENVNGSPAYRIKASLDNGTTAMMFVDKSSYLLTKTSASIDQGGMPVKVDSYPTDYKEVSGILIPMKTVSSTQMGEMVMIFENVEVNAPMDDTIFKVK